MEEKKFDTLYYYGYVTEINNKIFETKHKLKACRLIYRKYVEQYNVSSATYKEFWQKQIGKNEIEQIELECELELLLEEHDEFIKEVDEKYN